MAANVIKNRDKIKDRRSELVKTLINYNNIEFPKKTIENHIVMNSENKNYKLFIDETMDELVVRIVSYRDIDDADYKNIEKHNKEVEDMFKQAALIGGAVWGKKQ